MAKKSKEVAGVQKAFVVMEAVSCHGGFPVFMTRLMEDMEKAMETEGFKGPYKWTWSGGDGMASPVFLRCEFI